jgi:hypothetical protein
MTDGVITVSLTLQDTLSFSEFSATDGLSLFRLISAITHRSAFFFLSSNASIAAEQQSLSYSAAI